MDVADIRSKIVAEFDALPHQLQRAARWLIDHQEDIALLSMRAQAREAGVPPAAFTRVAQRLGFEGFEEIRAIHAAAMRERAPGFHGRATDLVERGAEEGDAALVMDMMAANVSHLRGLSESEALASLAAAADCLSGAKRVFCLGLRSGFPVAYLFAYLQSLIGGNAILVDGAGGIGVDALRDVGEADAVLAISVQPYTRQTIGAAQYAADHGAALVAVTDSALSPLAAKARATILVPTASPSFLHTMTPAFAAIEALAALTVARRGKPALDALAQSEAHLSAFDAYLPETKRGS